MLKRIGIMGGTFSPIHLGHIKLAKAAYLEFNLDKVLFIPSGNSYLKSDVLDSKYRLDMTRLAVKDYDYFEVSTMEIDRGGASYSYETLEELRRIYPDSKLYFIVGADSFLYMDKWKEPSKIFKNATVLVAVRDETTLDELKETALIYKNTYNAVCEFLSIDYINISSTEIRERIHEGKPVERMVPKSVYEYIKDNDLYL